MAEKKAKGSRFRSFATMVYEESAPEDWRNIVSELCVPCLVSPIHNRDVYEKDDPERGIKAGDLKKPHYHLLFMFEGMKSQEQIREMIALFGGVGIEVVRSNRAYARYLCHLDSPNKAQYNVEDVSEYGGADYSQYIAVKVDKHNAIREILKWCRETGTESYADLLDYAAENNDDWFSALCEGSGTMVIREYLKSRTWTRRNIEMPSPDSRVEGMTDFHAGNFRATMQERKEIEQKGFERLPDRTQCPFEQIEIDED